VRRYKSLLHPSLFVSLLPISTCNTQISFTTPLYFTCPLFSEICWGFKGGLRAGAWRVLLS
jgi:hypothetical protein